MGETRIAVDIRAYSYLIFSLLRVNIRHCISPIGETCRETGYKFSLVFWLVVYCAVRLVSFTGQSETCLMRYCYRTLLSAFVI
jgi:hypothetical protein